MYRDLIIQAQIHGKGEYSCEIKKKIRFLCIKFINKSLSSSLTVDVG